jgi:hypothetical protein
VQNPCDGCCQQVLALTKNLRKVDLECFAARTSTPGRKQAASLVKQE